jgi:hypothetical protein
MKRNAPSLAALWVLVFLLAVGIEWAGGRQMTLTDLTWSLAFLPVTAVVGGRAAFGMSASAALWSGIAFWPVCLSLSRRWLRQGPEPLTGFALGLWLLLGWAQPVSRLGMLMSA